MEDINTTCEWKNYRIKLHNLTDEQKQRIINHSNIRRFLYNWGLEMSNKIYKETGRTPNYQELSKMFTSYKKLPGNEWLDKANVNVCRYSFIDLGAAFHNFFTGIAKRPIFKSKKTDSIRIAVRPDCLTFKGEDGRYAFIPVLSACKGDLIDCGNHRIPHFKGIKYYNTRIKFDGNDFWLSLSVKLPREEPILMPMVCTNNTIGIDVGIRTAATLSNGKTYDRVNPYKLGMLEHRRDSLQAAVDRDIRRRMKESARTRTKYEDIPKSKNQLKRESKLAKTRVRIVNLHKSYYHKISREIADMHYDIVTLESLNIPRLIQNANGRGKNEIYEGRMATLAEYIEYKCKNNGTIVVRAYREFPSSQICSRCGNIHKPGPSKIYECPKCGLSIDRDLNASINLNNYGISAFESHMTNFG